MTRVKGSADFRDAVGEIINVKFRFVFPPFCFFVDFRFEFFIEFIEI